MVVASAVLLLGLLVVLMGVLLVGGEFGFFSPRRFYYLWLAGLIATGLALASRPALAAIPLSLAAIDLGLGAGSLVLERAGFGRVSMMPPQYYATEDFEWHPLLQAKPTPSFRGGPPGLEWAHSSVGTRDREYTADELAAKKVVAAFGGSTTYGLTVSDGETWTDQLEEDLGIDQWIVVNHGVPGYTSVETLVQTAFYADAFGRKPDCAVYYMGWNDLRNSGIENLDGAYAIFHLRSQIDALRTRRIDADTFTMSPLLTIIVRSVAIGLDTARPARRPHGSVIDQPDAKLERLFARNIRSISAINRSQDIKTLWVGQLLNVSALTGEEAGGWTPLIRQRDVWPFQQHLNAVLRRQAEAADDVYVDVPIDEFTAADFAYSGHFSAAGADKFAALLAPHVRDACR